MNDNRLTVAAQVAELPSLPMKDLWLMWDRYYNRRPDKTNRAFLESRLAYKIQEEAFGCLAPETKRRLIDIGARHSKIKTRIKPQEFVLPPGTVLIREWNERDHKVTVTPAGTFEYEGKHFKSLSAAARHISGTHWSGPAFFGLRKAGVRR